jgi:hypothetical protein
MTVQWQADNGGVYPGRIAKCGWMNADCTACALHDEPIDPEECEACEDYERES